MIKFTDDEISKFQKHFMTINYFLSNILFDEKKDKYFLHVITDYRDYYIRIYKNNNSEYKVEYYRPYTFNQKDFLVSEECKKILKKNKFNSIWDVISGIKGISSIIKNTSIYIKDMREDLYESCSKIYQLSDDMNNEEFIPDFINLIDNLNNLNGYMNAKKKFYDKDSNKINKEILKNQNINFNDNNLSKLEKDFN